MSPVLRRIFFEPALAHFGECVWRPAVDVMRAPYGWLIKAELPGVPPEQVQVAVRGNRVVLSGVRRDTLHAEGESYYRMEISYARFEREIELPASLEGAELRVSSQEGLLTVRIACPASGRAHGG